MKKLDALSPMDLSQYVFALGKQLSAGLSLEALPLLNDDEINALQGSAIEHLQVKAIHDLLRECRGEEFGLLCRYLLEKLVFQSSYDLQGRITHLAGRTRVRKRFELTETKRLFDNYIHYAQADLFKPNLILNAWNRLSRKEKIVVLSISGSALLGVAMNSISLNAGGGIPATGPGVLGRGVRTGAVQRSQMLNDIRQGISSNTRITAGSPGRKVVNKAPAVMRNILRTNIQQSVQPKLITKGGKGFISLKGIKLSKTSGKSGAALVLTFGLTGALSGVSNVQAHKEQGVILSYSEWLNVFFRGFIGPLGSVNPHSEQVDQYLKEKVIADQLAEQGTKFLEAFPQFNAYFVGLGQVSETKNKGEPTVVPGYSYVNLDQARPDLGEKDLVSEFRLGSPLGKVKIHYKKSRRTPKLVVGSAAELLCAPEFDAAKEVADSGLDDRAAYRCKEGFALRNTTQAAELPAHVYFDLSLTNQGQIIASRKDTNIVDASQIPGNGLYYVNNLITTTSALPNKLVEIEAYNIHRLIGRLNLVDRVICSPPLSYVAGQGGSGVELPDELYNCPHGLLSPYTSVHSNLPASHEYDINLGNGTIDIKLLKSKNLNLTFNLSANNLLERAVIRCNESREKGFVKLVLIIDATEITLHLLKHVAVSLSDNQGHQIFFQANEPDNFLMLERMAENVSSEKKLHACHAYQQRTLEDKQLACLMVKVAEIETEVIEDIFFIDEGGQGWSFIAGTEDKAVDFIPFYSKGVYSLTASELQKNPSLAISFPVANINYYRDRSDLVLVSKGYSFAEFSLRLKNYYGDPSLWNSLRLINRDTEALFDCDTGEHCLSGEALEGYSREATSLEAEIKTREQQLFTYYSLMPATNLASQTIYHNQQWSDSGEWQTVTEKEERLGFLKVEGFNPTDIQVRAEGSDLIFRIKTVRVGNHTFEFRFKNWDNAESHRIEGLIFPGFTSDKLSGFLSKEAALVERRLKKALTKAKAYDEAKQLLGPLQLARLQVLLVGELFATPWPSLVNKKTVIVNSLGFQDEEDLANFYFMATVSQLKNSALTLFSDEEALQKTTQALYWLAARTCLASNDPILVKKLFPMLMRPETLTSPSRSFCRQVLSSIATLPRSSIERFIQAEMTPERLEGIKDWLMKASNTRENISFFYAPKSIVQQQTNLDSFTYPNLDLSGSAAELSDVIYHSRYGGDEFPGIERRGFIDLNDTPGIRRVHISREAEGFKFTFISTSEFHYRPMKIKWDDSNQRIEGIRKDNAIVVEGLTALEDAASIESAINTGLSAKIEPRVAPILNPLGRGDHIAEAASKARALEKEKTWFQSAGSWFYGVGGAAVIGIGALTAFSKWLASRGSVMRRGYALQDVEKGAAAALIAATQVNSVESSRIEREEKLFEATIDEGIEGNFSALSNFPLQDFLALANVFVRNYTGVKYEVAGNYLSERTQATYLYELSQRILPVVNMTEEDWSNRFSADESGPDYVDLAYGNNKWDEAEGNFSSFSFSNPNCMTEENDWGTKTKLQKQKKTVKAYSEERVA